MEWQMSGGDVAPDHRVPGAAHITEAEEIGDDLERLEEELEEDVEEEEDEEVVPAKGGDKKL
jgi:putative ABC transport system ATP-binding protein